MSARDGAVSEAAAAAISEHRVMSGLLSGEATFTLYVAGPWGAREAEKIIAILQLQRNWLKEDENAATARRRIEQPSGPP